MASRFPPRSSLRGAGTQFTCGKRSKQTCRVFGSPRSWALGQTRAWDREAVVRFPCVRRTGCRRRAGKHAPGPGRGGARPPISGAAPNGENSRREMTWGGVTRGHGAPCVLGECVMSPGTQAPRPAGSRGGRRRALHPAHPAPGRASRGRRNRDHRAGGLKQQKCTSALEPEARNPVSRGCLRGLRRTSRSGCWALGVLAPPRSPTPDSRSHRVSVSQISLC